MAANQRPEPDCRGWCAGHIKFPNTAWLSCVLFVMIPAMQLLLVGCAINTTPHHLPTAVLLLMLLAMTIAVTRFRRTLD